MARVLVVAIAVLIGHIPSSSAGQIKPEMIVRFSEGSLVCLDRDHLQEITQYAIKGQATKVEAMMAENGGDCIMVAPSQKFKVLSAEYNDPNLDIGILEIIGEGKVKLNGAWSFSVGAEEVLPTSYKNKN